MKTRKIFGSALTLSLAILTALISALTAEAQSLGSGAYRLQVRNSGSVHTSVWRLQVYGSQITGTAEWECCPGPRVDRLRGYVQGARVVIERDCQGQGIDGPCQQIYYGVIGNGVIQGTFTGRGAAPGNAWTLYPGASQPTQIYPNLLGIWYDGGRNQTIEVFNTASGLQAWSEGRQVFYTALRFESSNVVIAVSWGGPRGIISNNGTRIDWHSVRGALAGGFWTRQPINAAGPTQTPNPAAKLIDWDASPYRENVRDKINRRFTYRCSANGVKRVIWGTDAYTDDSSICTAAVHSGLISFASGGIVTIEIRPTLQSYTASVRYGVDSYGYSATVASFVFVR